MRASLASASNLWRPDLLLALLLRTRSSEIPFPVTLSIATLSSLYSSTTRNTLFNTLFNALTARARTYFVLLPGNNYNFYIISVVLYIQSAVREMDPYHLTVGAGKERKRHFLSTFHVKMVILPRQARDTHRENSKQSAVFLQASPATNRNTQTRPSTHPAQVILRKRILSPLFVLTTITLPRQARDKHRESTQKRRRLFSYFQESTVATPWMRCRCCRVGSAMRGRVRESRRRARLGTRTLGTCST